jgi:hypothetical protein
MGAEHLAAWISTIARWLRKLPRCQDPDCGAGRRLWWRLSGKHAGIALQGAWYCGAECFERAVRELLSRAVVESPPAEPAGHRIPLGLVLLSRGKITHPQLQAALEAQRVSGGGRIGEWLEDLGFVTGKQVTAALGLQWACPVLPGLASNWECAGLVPFHLLEQVGMVPVRYIAARRMLYVAFADGVHYPALYAIEQMLHCHTEPCLVERSVLEAQLAKLLEHTRAPGFVFEGPGGFAEMGRTTTSYALKLGAREVRVSALSGLVWVRMEAPRAVTDLVFCHARAATRPRLPAPGYRAAS